MELIRKIVVGINPKDAMAYFIGQRAGDASIDAILLDKTYFHNTGKRRYLIYISNENSGTMLWKTVEDMPCLIEYDCNF
jgi:hypothetical protein